MLTTEQLAKALLLGRNCENCAVIQYILYEPISDAQNTIKDLGCKLQIELDETSEIKIVAPQQFICERYTAS
jgi:hypothetical protein